MPPPSCPCARPGLPASGARVPADAPCQCLAHSDSATVCQAVDGEPSLTYGLSFHSVSFHHIYYFIRSNFIFCDIVDGDRRLVFGFCSIVYCSNAFCHAMFISVVYIRLCKEREGTSPEECSQYTKLVATVTCIFFSTHTHLHIHTLTNMRISSVKCVANLRRLSARSKA